MNDKDHAIVVGIDLYPGLSSLAGAQGDAKAFADWLADPGGGNLPQGNIHPILTSQYHPPPPPRASQADPNEQRFSHEIQALLATEAGQRRPFPVGRRLYLYFSGHGFLGSSDWEEAALYAANATTIAPEHIAGTRIANAVKNVAAFQEIVLVMDCCRDVSLTRQIASPILLLGPASPLAATVRTFYAYAVPRGGKARERQILPGGPVQGVFTYVLLEALRQAPGDEHGRVNGLAIKNYIHNRWLEVAEGTPSPKIEVDSATDVTLAIRPVVDPSAAPEAADSGGTRTNVLIAVRPPVPAGGVLVVLDGKLRELLRLSVVDGSVSCSLAPGIYKARLDGTDREKLFQAMGISINEQL